MSVAVAAAATAARLGARRRLAACAPVRHAMLRRGGRCSSSPSPLTSPVFGTLGNAENILRQTASVLVLGLGMTLVVLVGGIDLSVGSVVLASATLAGIVLAEGLHPAARDARRRSASGARSALLNAAPDRGRCGSAR